MPRQIGFLQETRFVTIFNDHAALPATPACRAFGAKAHSGPLR